MARVYRDMRNRKLDTSEGSRLVYVLSQIGKAIIDGEIEQRLIALESESQLGEIGEDCQNVEIATQSD